MKCYLADAEDLHKRLRRVIEEREVAYGDDPMGKTGLCDRKFKIQGSREYPVIVEQYTTDFGLLRAMREIEKKVAIFTGQWGKKREKAVATPEACQCRNKTPAMLPVLSLGMSAGESARQTNAMARNGCEGGERLELRDDGQSR